jgi:hypothetical protein
LRVTCRIHAFYKRLHIFSQFTWAYRIFSHERRNTFWWEVQLFNCKCASLCNRTFMRLL